ncbi:MAG: hypothetical protein WDN24_18985 [Sphingomonas sp.]
MTAHRFTVAGYRALIHAFLERGYAAVGYRGFAGTERRLLLRHDVDLSPGHAVRQAEVNRELGVAATFFFLVSSEQYNLCSAAGRAALAAVAANGQRIGLHFDAASCPPDALEAHAARECAILESLCGCPLEAVSFHRPVQALQGLEGSFAGLPHAYEPRFFRAIEYCSDSRGGFHHGSPLDRPAFAAGAPFQLLTHPIWWMREAELAPAEALLDLLRAREPALRRDLAEHCEPFAAYLAAQG